MCFGKTNIIIGLYVDDILITGELCEVEDFTKKFGEKYKSRVFDEVNDFIGCELVWNSDKSKVILHQSGMIEKMDGKVKPYLDKYNIKKRNVPMTKGTSITQVKENEEEMSAGMQKLYRSCVGSLLYIVKHSRPDLSNTVRELSKVNKRGKVVDFINMLQCCKFLFSTRNLGIQIERNILNKDWKLYGYCDSDWGSDLDTRKSVTGIAIFVNGNLINWSSRGQKTVSLASSHAEYVAISEICRELLYVKHLMCFLGIDPFKPIVIYCDNAGAIFLSNNQESRLSKHLDIKCHFIRSYVENGTVKIVFVKSSDNVADGFTKSGSYEEYSRNFKYLKNVCYDNGLS